MSPKPSKVLVNFAHPLLDQSRVNTILVGAIQGMEGVTVNDLYEVYPEFDIDVGREQALLEEHDIVIFQHPFFWYSTPAILKEWQDLVLQHGWAYGSSGTKLHGKTWMHATSTGGREAAYHRDGVNGHSMRELLAPLAQTAKLCGMRFLPPFVTHGSLGMPRDRIRQHAEDYRRVVEALRDGRIDLERAQSYPRINLDLDTIIGRPSDGADPEAESAGDRAPGEEK